MARAKGASPTKRSLDEMRRNGYLVGIVERFNHHAKFSSDLFGFADLLAFNQEECILIQTTTRPNLNARRVKIAASKFAVEWLANPARQILLHGWKGGELTQELAKLDAMGRIVFVPCGFTLDEGD